MATAWYEDWFGEAYLALYPHRDEAEAASGVRLFREAAKPPSGAWVLDLACGAGRHLPHLEAAGHRAVGMDLSATLLAEAREAAGPGALLVRGDMRDLPFAEDGFGAVTSFFTSFGYFDTVEEDRRVAGEMARVLRSGGAFLLDYLNAPFVRESLVPSDERVVQGRAVRQTRWIENATVVKKIEVLAEGEGEPEVHHERVRLYEPAELDRLLGSVGLISTARFGDYEGAPHTRASPRLILVGRAR